MLRHDKFTYYNSATDLYFPTGNIDLRYAIRAGSLPDADGNTGESQTFELITENETYIFRTDCAASAHDWVRALQKEIFRSRNQGDLVKIQIPLKNILEIEESMVFGLIQALKIRAIKSDESSVIDEYTLAFLHRGKGHDLPAQSIRRGMQNLELSDSISDFGELDSSRKSLGQIIDSTYAAQVPDSMSPSGTSARSQTLGPVGRRSYSPRPLSSIGKIVSKTFANFGSSSRPSSPTFDESESSHRSLFSESYLDSSDETALSSVEDPVERKRRFPRPATAVVNKVSEMLTTGSKGSESKDSKGEKKPRSEEERRASIRRFQGYFSFPDTEELIATHHCYILKGHPIYGKLYISHNFVCFRSLFPGTNTNMVLPSPMIESVSKESGFRFGYSGMVIVIRSSEEVFFEFRQDSVRSKAVEQISKILDVALKRKPSLVPAVSEYEKRLRHARLLTYCDYMENATFSDLELHNMGVVETTFDASTPAAKPARPLKFTVLTIGSRGDVQPYISLALGLMKEGHSVKIASHAEFRDWVEGYGIEYAEIAGDPAELMKIMAEHGMFSVSFIRAASRKFRSWIDELLTTSWVACQGSDVLIESPSAMGGIHIAEALQIPYFRVMAMPWTRTRAYPHAFMVPDVKKSGAYNYMTYVLFDTFFWKGISGQVNKWRQNTLHIEKTNLDLLQQSKVPFLYNVSPAVLVPPVDFSDWIQVTGYWFLDEGAGNFQPPDNLVKFIKQARTDGKKLVYIGFGSIVVENPTKLTKAVVDSVLNAGVRCILSKGWSDRYDAKDSSVPEIKLPDDLFLIKSAPHDWLFPQMDAAVHHGGSGTTGASLRAGCPTIVKPFFGDQFFYGGRVEELGVGLCLKKLTVSQFTKALVEVTTNEKIIARAEDIGKSIRSEDGVSKAIATIYREMKYARSLIKKKLVPSTSMDSSQSTVCSKDNATWVTDSTEESIITISDPVQVPIL